ncbi:Armadillo repeat-containing protein 4 [Fasciola gigantica]|uniref:Armadillo repeat-containing protein 4 n=1 Tax=Fasciola gigantica TaxID=46835 RepID=A0A504Z0S8_FASGI|nr:Armadillo repeat-containing protein 4 [Fasciola gigantica]
MDSIHDDIRLPPIQKNGESHLTTLSKVDISSSTDQISSGSTLSTNSASSTSSRKTPSMTTIIREWHNHNTRLKYVLGTDRNQNAESLGFVEQRFNKYTSKSIQKRPYEEVVNTLKKLGNKGRFTDFITRERTRHPKIKQVAFNDFYKLDMSSLQQEMRETLDPELQETEASPFAHEIDEELQRRDFEEFIVLQSISPSEMGHLYFKIIKLFRYVSITNVQGTLIALLSLNRLIKRSPEVVQAVEESDGIALLLNLLDCKILSVQLASMQLLSSLFQVMYLRRMAIAYGAVQVLVELLLESDDNIQVMTSDLLADLALLSEARQIIPQTKGIQHLVCLLNMTTHRTETMGASEKSSPNQKSADRRHSLINEELLRAREDMLRGERVLVSVATALWRFSRSTINRRIMQRAGLVLTLVQLVRKKNEKILVPVLGILQGCATDAAFRLSIRTEGILKFLIKHLRCADARVRLQCSRTLYYCADDDKTKEMICTLGGLNALCLNLKSQTNEATRMLRTGWIDSNTGVTVECSSGERCSRKEENNNSSAGTNSPTETKPEVRVSRLRMAGPTTSQARTGSASSRASVDLEDDSVNFQLLHTILATIGRCSTLESNLIALNELGATEYMIKLLNSLPQYLMTYRQPSCAVSPRLQKVTLLERVCALNIHCLSLIARLPAVQIQLVSSSSSLGNLIDLLTHISPDILVPTINAIASMAADTNLMHLLNKQNGFRYLFSLSFHADTHVRTAALWAVRAFLKTAPSRSALLRPVSSSLGYLVQALRTEYTNLQTSIKKPNLEKEQILSALCSVLAEIASEDQGRAILIELGVVPFLANLTTIAQEDCLRIGISSAISQFGSSDTVIKFFRDREVLNALIEFLRLGSQELKISAAHALDALSTDSVICSSIRALDVTSAFLQIMCDAPHDLQTAAAHVIGRIARLSLSTSRSGTKH